MRLDTIEIPHGWSARRIAAGLVLTSGDALLHVRLVERVRPLRHPRVVLAQLSTTADEVRWPPRAVTTLETCEGELALRTGDQVDDGGSVLARELGMIVGDDWSTHVIGVADAQMRELIAGVVDELTRGYRMYLGVRRRRFWYEPPSGWQGISLDDFDAHYFAPEHPRALGCLSVYAAVPSTTSLDAWWTSAASTHVAATFDPTPIVDERFVGPDQIAGRRVRLFGHDGATAVVAELTCLADRDYWYPFVLVSEAKLMPERGQLLSTLISSMRPLSRRTTSHRTLAAVQHWFT